MQLQPYRGLSLGGEPTHDAHPDVGAGAWAFQI